MGKYLESMIKKYGSREAFKEEMRRRGSTGGKNGKTEEKGWNRRKELIAQGVKVKPVHKSIKSA